MGLDIGCKCGKVGFRAGSYSRFNAYRYWVAKVMGNSLEQSTVGMGGHKFDHSYPNYEKGDPFFDFFNHSDCEGVLGVRECRRLVPAFQGVLDRVRTAAKERALKDPAKAWVYILEKELAFESEEELYFYKKTEDWLEACRHASEDKCRLEFG